MMRPTLRRFAAFAVLAILGSLLAADATTAQPGRKKAEAYLDNFASIATMGPTKGQLGSRAVVEVPKGFAFIGQGNMPKLNKLLGNLDEPGELGGIVSEDEWYIIFQFSEEGYVKDDEKDKIDAAKILEARKSGEAEGNKQRQAAGLRALNITGWALAPYYDNELKSLASAIKLTVVGAPPGNESVNFESKILGRKGYMNVVLVCTASQFDAILPKYKDLIKGFAYIDGEKYSDFKAGDKVAEYGLYALAAGGGVAVLAKAGILGKLLKPLLIVGALVIAGFAKFFGSIFGKKKQEA